MDVLLAEPGLNTETHDPLKVNEEVGEFLGVRLEEPLIFIQHPKFIHLIIRSLGDLNRLDHISMIMSDELLAKARLIPL